MGPPEATILLIWLRQQADLSAFRPNPRQFGAVGRETTTPTFQAHALHKKRGEYGWVNGQNSDLTNIIQVVSLTTSVPGTTQAGLLLWWGTDLAETCGMSRKPELV